MHTTYSQNQPQHAMIPSLIRDHKSSLDTKINSFSDYPRFFFKSLLGPTSLTLRYVALQWTTYFRNTLTTGRRPRLNLVPSKTFPSHIKHLPTYLMSRKLAHCAGVSVKHREISFSPTALPLITVIDFIIEETHIKKLLKTVI